MGITDRHNLFEIAQPDLWIDIDMTAHMRCPLRDTQFDQTCSTDRNRLRLCQFLLLEFNAFAHVETSGTRPVRLPFIADKAFVQVDVAIDKPRKNEPATKIVNVLRRQGGACSGSDCDDSALADSDIDNPPVGQPGISKQRVDFSQLNSPKR